jgi:hypothetical protein
MRSLLASFDYDIDPNYGYGMIYDPQRCDLEAGGHET